MIELLEVFPVVNYIFLIVSLVVLLFRSEFVKPLFVCFFFHSGVLTSADVCYQRSLHSQKVHMTRSPLGLLLDNLDQLDSSCPP